MKNALLYSCTLLMAIVLWGCPYKSQVPLDKAIERVDTNMLGKWVVGSMLSHENPEYYVIDERDSVRYDVGHFQFNDDSREYTSKHYVGHTTRIGPIVFMNLLQLESREYLIYRIDLLPGRGSMTKYEVTNNIDEKFEDPKAMREFFEKYMKLSFFYNTDEVELIRKDK